METPRPVNSGGQQAGQELGSRARETSGSGFSRSEQVGADRCILLGPPCGGAARRVPFDEGNGKSV